MLPEFMTVLGYTVLTYTLVLALGVLLAALLVARRLRHTAASAGQVADLLLAALAGALLLARAEHVALNWAHFQFHTREIFSLTAGGLGWHGAVCGALAGAWLAARWQHRRGLQSPDVTALLAALLPALPLLVTAGWAACASIRCGYGAEVPTLAGLPALVALEAPDRVNLFAPRYNTHALGMLLGLALGLVALLPVRFTARRRGTMRRAGLLLALCAAGMLGIGFLRGDYAVSIAGLRLDQWLDLLTGVVGVLLMLPGSKPREVVPAAVPIIDKLEF